MADTKNPLSSYNFLVRVNGISDIPCKSVHMFAKQCDYEYIKEGGVNDHVHVKRKQAQGPNIVKIERYVSDDVLTTFGGPGSKMILPMLVLVSKYPGEFSSPYRMYTFTGCTVMKVEYGELSAENGQLLTEIISISYEDVVCVDNPMAKEKAPWEFDGTKVSGKGKRYARSVGDYGVSTSNDDSKKRKWPTTSSRVDINKYL